MSHDGTDTSSRLFWALAEQLKIPLMQIMLTEGGTKQIGSAETARLVIELLDSYQLGVSGQVELDLRPTMVPLMLEEVAHKLSSHARAYNCELVVEASGYNKPSMADRRLLSSAFLALGYGMIEAQGSSKKPQLVFSAHRGHRDLAVGAFGRQDGFSQASLSRFRRLAGRAQQPWPEGLASSGAGVFLADRLLQAMNMTLRASRHGQLSGLASTLISSHQLELISP